MGAEKWRNGWREVRTSKELHKWLGAQAKKNGHSLNQECEARLRIDGDYMERPTAI
jgi:predicted HicB family RNase H-like nuclease